MPLSSLFAYAYLVGIAFSACAAALAELLVKRPAGMREPFVSPDHILRSLILIAIAGPYLLICELKEAHQNASISAWLALTGILLANSWALALGIVLVEAMSVLTRPF
jgi:uncharacterized membrane protein YbjE (DUF340 family)